MARFMVVERQSLTYTWYVDADDAQAAADTAVDGVPEEARERLVHSEVYAALVPEEQVA